MGFKTLLVLKMATTTFWTYFAYFCLKLSVRQYEKDTRFNV